MRRPVGRKLFATIGRSLNRYDRSTFYGGDARGYIDYPLAEVAPAD